MSRLTYPYLDRKGSFLGCFEVINPYLNVVSIMNYQTKRGGKALIYSFLLQLCMMCFHWRLWKVFHHASHPEVVKGQNRKELTPSCLLQVQTDSVSMGGEPGLWSRQSNERVTHQHHITNVHKGGVPCPKWWDDIYVNGYWEIWKGQSVMWPMLP